MSAARVSEEQMDGSQYDDESNYASDPGNWKRLIFCAIFRSFLFLYTMIFPIFFFISEVCDVSTQTDPEYINIKLAIHGGDTFFVSTCSNK